MRFDIMTLFPELVDTVLGTSIIGRAASAGYIDIRTHDIRDWSPDHEKMGKGVTLSKEEFNELIKLINE